MPRLFILRKKCPNFQQIVSWSVCKKSSRRGESVSPLRRVAVSVSLYKQRGQDALATSRPSTPKGALARLR